MSSFATSSKNLVDFDLVDRPDFFCLFVSDLVLLGLCWAFGAVELLSVTLADKGTTLSVGFLNNLEGSSAVGALSVGFLSRVGGGEGGCKGDALGRETTLLFTGVVTGAL